MAHSTVTQAFFLESRLRDAGRGDSKAYFDLGMAFSSGAGGAEVDLIQAHKWFNLAALGGSGEAQRWRAEISDEMSAREIAEAQRQARAWLNETGRRAA